MNTYFQNFCKNVEKQGYIQLYAIKESNYNLPSIILCAYDGEKYFRQTFLFSKTYLKKYNLNHKDFTFKKNLDAKLFNIIYTKFNKLNPKRNFLKQLNKFNKFVINE